MDFITDFPPSGKLGVKILLVIINRLSKGVILILILLISAPAVAMAFIKHYCHGASCMQANGAEGRKTID